MHIKDLICPLKYFSVKIGDMRVENNTNDSHYILFSGGNVIMTNDKVDTIDLGIEVYYGYGKCITTGIGLAIKESMLSLKQEVKEIICYEKNRNMIELFYAIMKYNNFDHSKIKVIHGDAENIHNLDCDCLFLDHYTIEDCMQAHRSAAKISKNNNSKITWYWPAIRHYISYVDERNLPLTKQTFSDWAKPLNIKNMPCNLSDEVFDLIVQFKNIEQGIGV